MFDSDEAAGWPTRALLDAVASNQRSLREAECSQLLLAAAWADDQKRDAGDPWPVRGQRSTIEARGGRRHGLVAIDEDAVCEFGAILGLGYVSARNLIHDALDLRLRCPHLWRLIRTAALPAWHARKIAQQARPLDEDQAAELDDRLAPVAALMPWPRLERILTGAVCDLDPDGVRARQLRARTERFVRAYDSDDGLKTLIARATSGDVIWFMAAVNRIADILAEQGDTDTVDVRRSRAVGLLAQPARAMQLITAHARRRPAIDSRAPDPGHHTTSPDRPGHSASGPFTDTKAEPGIVVGEAGEAARRLNDELDDHDARTCGIGELDDETGQPAAVADPVRSAEQRHIWTDPTGVDLSGVDLSGVDARRLRPRVVLYFHLSEAAVDPGGPGGLVRPEHGGPLSLDQLHEFLADTGCQISVRPVVTPADTAPADHYEIPHRIREAVRLRDPVDAFPYGSSDLRGLDLDHTVPYQAGGPPGQTGPHNLAPLSRTAHRAATLRVVPDPSGRSHGRLTGRWQKRQPAPGLHLWRSPHGWTYLTTHQGTITLGRSGYGDRLWLHADQPTDADHYAHQNG